MLIPDHNLPFLDLAWSPPRMQELLNRAVMRLRPGSDVTDLAIQDMAYWPGKRCVVLYAIRLSEAPDRRSRFAVATFTTNDKLGRVATQADAAVFLPEYRCLVELFPHDVKLPHLNSAADPCEVASRLSRIGLKAEPSSSPPEAHVLQYRAHQRCVLRYGLKSADGQWAGDVVGKFYPRGPKAARAWHAHTALHEQPLSGMVIPRPLALLDDLDVVLMEHVQGTALETALYAGPTPPAAAENVVRRLAAVVASLHGATYHGEEVQTLQRQLQLFRDRSFNLHLVAPLLAEEVNTQLGRIEALAAECTLDALSCIHGECKASQFLMTNEAMAIVDFDRFCLGDPAIDVGNFMAAMHRAAIEMGYSYCRGLADAFLAAYLDLRPGKDLEARARLFQAASLVRMAVRAMTRAPYLYRDLGSESLPVRLLEEAMVCSAHLSRA